MLSDLAEGRHPRGHFGRYINNNAYQYRKNYRSLSTNVCIYIYYINNTRNN